MSGITTPSIPPYVPPVSTGWRSQIEQQQARRQDPPAPPAATDPATPPTEPTPPAPPAFTPITSQEEWDRAIGERLARERAKYADYDELRTRAARADELEQANQTESERAIAAAREEGRAEVRQILAQERVRNTLTTALIGRVPDPVALLDLDRAQFIRDGNANVEAIQQWVDQHSTAATAATPPPPAVTVTPDPSQGAGGQTSSIDAGRAAYERRHGRPAPATT